MPNPQLHAAMHVVVENQLAAGDRPEVSATLERLMTAGLTRHEAVHAVATVVAEALFKVMKQKVEFDQAAVARACRAQAPFRHRRRELIFDSVPGFALFACGDARVASGP